MVPSDDIQLAAVGAVDRGEEHRPDVALRVSFVTFYHDEYRSVLGLARVLTGSPSAGEDIAQDAFVAAYRSWDRISAYESPGGWIRRVVVNRSVSRTRRLISEGKALIRLCGDRGDVEPATDEAIWDLVRALPRRQRQVIALMYLDQLSIPETAAVLGCSVPTVKTHLARARRALADRLGEDVDETDR